MSASICGSSRRARLPRAKADGARDLPRLRRGQGARHGRRRAISARSADAISPFEGKPWSVYVPAEVRLVGHRDDAARARRLLGARQPANSSRGSSRRRRSARKCAARAPMCAMSPTSCPKRKTAESLLVVEVITPGGHTSSYPPHKHDQRRSAARVAARGDLLSPPQPAPGLRLPARLYRRPLARRGDGGGGRRCDPGAEGLSSGRRHAWLRSLLSQRHGRPEAHLEIPQRAGARMAAHQVRRVHQVIGLGIEALETGRKSGAHEERVASPALRPPATSCSALSPIASACRRIADERECGAIDLGIGLADPFDRAAHLLIERSDGARRRLQAVARQHRACRGCSRGPESSRPAKSSLY